MLGSKKDKEYFVGRFEVAYYYGNDEKSDFNKVSTPIFSKDLLLTPDEFTQRFAKSLMESLAQQVEKRIGGLVK